MACRVGMSTTPYTRIEYWKEAEGHTHGQVLETDLTYDEALVREKAHAEANGCRYHGGGQKVAGRVWSIYYVSGGR